jgi:exopolyphosphatase/guanosine-5'-triphosphate,3'-diphosphate pyrophosphatase
VRAVGTAVFRRAANAREFIDAARRKCGFEIAVLADLDEARLGWLAAVADGADERSRLVDVGGGSTEVVADAGATRVSAPIGAVVPTEAWQGDFGGCPFEDAAWHGLLDDVRREVAALGGLADAGGGPVVALGGTGLNLACLELGLEEFAPARVEGASLRAARAREWPERLRRLPPRDRLALPLERERAAILPAGLVCLAGALAALGAEEFSVTGRGLRFGVARELVAGSPRRAPGG